MEQNDLFQSAFGDIHLEKRAAHLQKIVNDYPYFSLAHYFLLKHTSASDSDYKKIAGRSALHFNSPFYLNYLLSKRELTQNNVQPPVEQPSSGIPAASQLNKPDPILKVKSDELLFEPLHTTDYFASQGIKLGEIKQDDKLGVQLKSFTDWLKTMKKVHDQKLPVPNQQIDLAVQTIAEKSNEEQDVITESMAEVYVTQGKTAKAIEVYRKLSLMNPPKSAYFAAKIHSLNNK